MWNYMKLYENMKLKYLTRTHSCPLFWFVKKLFDVDGILAAFKQTYANVHM